MILALKHPPKTPFMIIDREVIRRQCKEFKKAMPDIGLYYAIKCLPDEEVIRVVNEYAAGYDVASAVEIKLLLGLGINPERMLYSNPVKSRNDIVYAFKAGVRRYAFQSSNELDKLADSASGSEVYARVAVGDSSSELAFSSKFGANPNSVVDMFIKARNSGLKPAGLTFHVGSQAQDKNIWGAAISLCADINHACATKGIKLQFINIGGGFPVLYSENVPTIAEIATVINYAIENRLSKLQYFAEPGRFMVADAGTIITTIIGVEERQGKTWLFTDVGAFQSFIEIFEFNYFPYPVYSLSHTQNYIGGTQQYALTGPSCDSFDTLTHDIRLPAGLKEGDQLAIIMTGAYTTVYGSNFNGFNIPKKVFVN